MGGNHVVRLSSAYLTLSGRGGGLYVRIPSRDRKETDSPPLLNFDGSPFLKSLMSVIFLHSSGTFSDFQMHAKQSTPLCKHLKRF